MPFGMLTVGEMVRAIASGRLIVGETAPAIRGGWLLGERPEGARDEDPDHLLAIGMGQVGVVEWLPGLECGVGGRVDELGSQPLANEERGRLGRRARLG